MASNNQTNSLLNMLTTWMNQTFTNKSITIEMIQEFCENSSNPTLPPCSIQTFEDILHIINKHNRWDLVPFILEQDSNIINNIHTNYKLKLIEQLRLKPLYNFHIFYTTIRWGDCELFDLLIAHYKLDDYASNDKSGKKLDALISDNLKLLMLRRVVVRNEIKQKCEEILFEIRFITKESLVNNIEISVDERIQFILYRINELVTISEINSLFLLASRAIADNLFVLKNKVQHPLNQLPWGHMEFFIAIFLHKFDAGYKLTLTFDVNKLINYLILFKDELINIKNSLPITAGCFDEFYEEFQLNRSFLALTRIARYMKAIDTPCSDDVVMRLAIERCVQVTGENLKSSDMSPNISAEVERLFEASAPNFLESIREMRNALSHVEYMESRLKIVDKIYLKLKKELKTIYPKILDIIFMQHYYKFECFINACVEEDNKFESVDKNIKIVSVKNYLLNSAPYLDDYLNPELLKACLIQGDDPTGSNEKLLHCFCKNIKAKDRLDLLQLLLNVIDNIHNVANIEEFFMLSTPETRNFLNDLYKILTNKNRSDFDNYRKMLSKQPQVQLETNKIQEEIKKVIGKICTSNNLDYEIFNECLLFGDLFKSLIKSINKNSDDFKDLFESIKNQTKIELFHNNLPSSRKELRVFTNQLKNLDYEDTCAKIIKLYLKENEKNKNDKIVKLFNTLLQTIYNIDISDSAKSAVKIWLKLNTKDLIQNVCNSLKHLLTHNSKDELHRAALEMCNLDILELYKEDQLSNINAPFYESYPILLGKVMRNHLAHYNILFDQFPNDHSLLLTANKLTDINFLKFLKNNNCRIGTCNPITSNELIYTYKQSELLILNQIKLFEAAQTGTLQKFQEWLRLSDIASNLNNKNVAIYATIGDNLDVFKYLLNTTKFSLDLKKLAIQHNSVNILKLLLNLDGIKGDELHYAVLYNQLNIAEILLELVNSKSFSNNLTPLHLACLLGRIEMATLLIQNGADIEARDAKYNAPIHLAAIIGNLDILNLLLSNQAETASFGSNERTAMHFAAGNGHINLITALLPESTNINSQDRRNQTPLHLAAQSGYTEIASLLLQNGAKIDLKDADGNTPTHLATIHKNYNTFQLLITPQPTLQSNNNGDTILHLINNYEMALLLPIEPFVNCRNKLNRTPLHCAVINNNEKIVNLLVERGANLYLLDNLTNKPIFYAKFNPIIKARLTRFNLDESEDTYLLYTKLYNKYPGNTLNNKINFDNVIDLFQYNYFENLESTLQKINVDVAPLNLNDMLLHAAFNGEKNRVLELVASGADIHTKFADKINLLEMAAFNNHLDILNSNWLRELPGNSALMVSAWNNHVEGIQLLLDAGVDVNFDFKGWKALHVAALMGNVESIEILVKNGSTCTCTPDGSLTPLQLAADRGHEEAVKKLLLLGIDIYHNKYPPPLYIATLNGHETIVKILIDNQEDINLPHKGLTPLFAAVKTNNVLLINVLIANGADINILDNVEETCLHFAIYNRAHKSIKALMDLGIGPNTASNVDTTYLQTAALISDTVAINLLLDRGADINQFDSRGCTALHYACSDGCMDTIKLLLDRGAKVFDCGFKNPLLIASMSGHNEVVKILLDQGISVNSFDKENQNSLHLAVLAGHMSTVELLLDNHADVNASTNSNLTAIIFAVVNRNVPLINVLIKKGADITHLNEHNKTVLHYALNDCKSLWEYQKIESYSIENVLGVLLKNGADVNAIDNFNLTPLHLINKQNAIKLWNLYHRVLAELGITNNSELNNHLQSAWDDLVDLVGKHVANIDEIDKNEAALNELLLKNGANVNASDDFFTALDYAVIRAHLYSVQVLLRYGGDINLKSLFMDQSAVSLANSLFMFFKFFMSICSELNDVAAPMLDRYQRISNYLSRTNVIEIKN